MKALLISSFLLFTILISCTKPPDYPIEPVIEFANLSRTSMNQGTGLEDSLIVTFSYTDGDGDLGSNSDSLEVFCTDLRLPIIPITYKLPFVPPQGTGNGISGEISIQIPTSCCIFPNNTPPPCNILPSYPRDTLVYEIFIKDRAGNESNKIITTDITLNCN